MSTQYNFTSSGPINVTAFDASAAHEMESACMPDSSVGLQMFTVYQIDLVACGTAAARILDNSADINRICAMAGSDISGQIVAQTFRFPYGLAINADYTQGLIIETTAAAQVRGVIHYTKDVKQV